MNTSLEKINFHGNDVYAVKDEQTGKVYVALKPICEILGIKWETQRLKINRDSILSEATLLMGGGINYELTVLDYEYLNGWLFGISENRVKPEAKELLIKYKRECFKVLNDYFNKGVAVNARFSLEQIQEQYEKLTSKLDNLDKINNPDIFDRGFIEDILRKIREIASSDLSDSTKEFANNIKKFVEARGYLSKKQANSISYLHGRIGGLTMSDRMN